MVRLCLFLKQCSDRVLQNPAEVRDLQPFDLNGQENAGADQQEQHQRAPGKAVDRAVDGFHFCNKVFHVSPSFSLFSSNTTKKELPF